jgi:PAS domain S-box-containing protein
VSDLQSDHTEIILYFFQREIVMTISPFRRNADDRDPAEQIRQLKEEIFSLKQTMKACREENYRHRLALDAVNEGLWDWNLKSGEVYFTPRYYTMLGYEPYEMPPSFETWLELLHPEDREISLEKLKDYLTGKTEYFEIEFRMKKKSGHWLWILGRGRIIARDETGIPLRIIGTHADINCRKLDEARTAYINGVLRAIREIDQLILREKNRENIIRGACDILVRTCSYRNVRIFLMEKNGRPPILAESGTAEQSPSFTELMEQGQDIPCIEIVRKKSAPLFIVHPSPFCRDCPVQDGEKGENTLIIPLCYRNKEYGILSFTLPENFFPDDTEQELLVNIAGDIAFCLYSLDLEEQREITENNLRKYGIIISEIRDPVFFIDRNYTLQSANKAFLDMLHISAEESIGQTLPGLMGGEFFAELYKEEVDRCFSGKSIRYQERISLNEGRQCYLDIALYPYREKNGSVSGVIMNSRDISSLKETEASLVSRTYELGERVKELNCLIGISVLMEKPDIALEDIFRESIRMLCASFQYPGIACACIRLADGRTFFSRNFRESPWTISNEIIGEGRHFGQIRIFYREKAPMTEDGPFLPEEKMLLHSVAERLGKVLDRRKAEQALTESERRFRDLVENSPVGIAIIREHRVVYENPEQKRLGLFGSGTGFPTFDNLHPEDMEKIRILYQDVACGDQEKAETDFRFYPFRNTEKKTEILWVNCRMNRILFQERNAVLINCIDITRAREMEKLLGIRDKMSSLGRVAAGIAHEIRNPLSGINIYLDALEQMADYGEYPEKILNITQKIQSASDKIESIIKRVMDFSKPGEPKFTYIDIRGPLEDAMQLSGVSLRKSGIILHKNLPGEAVICHADAHMIERVMLNLINNAAEAMRRPEIREKHLEIALESDHQKAMIRVSDSGTGIPADAVRKIFDPFYSTKSYGTGIGLSLCHRIITDHRGSLDVSAGRRGGAEFIIQLPLQTDTEL